MIDLAASWSHPDLGARFCEVELFRDTSDPDLFFAVPGAPDFERDDEGRPLCEIVFHGTRPRDRFEISGAIVSVTTRLGPGETLREALEQRLCELLDRPVAVRSPRWDRGEVRVELGEAPALEGRPSLFGLNTCALQASLRRSEARTLKKSLADDALDGSIVYTVTAGGRPGAYRRTTTLTGASSLGAATSRMTDREESTPPTGPLSLTLRRSFGASDLAAGARDLTL